MSTTPATSLYVALLAATRDFNPVVKNKQNPHLKNFYADLSAVLEAVTEPLANHGLLIVQRFTHNEHGPILITEIIHAASGERTSSELPVISKDPTDPQKLGGAITYARRYSLLAILSLTAEDDDGNSASQPATARQKRQRDDRDDYPGNEGANAVKDQAGIGPPRGTYQQQPAPRAATGAAPTSNGNRIAYNDPRHTATYEPQKALREEVAAREAEAATEHPLLATIRDDTADPKKRETALHNYLMTTTSLQELAVCLNRAEKAGIPDATLNRARDWHNERIMTGKAPAPKKAPQPASYAG